MVNKKIVIICSVLALIIVALVIGIKIKQFKENYYKVSGEVVTDDTNKTQNTAQNIIKEENVVDNNTVEENTTTEKNETTAQNQNTIVGAEEEESKNNSNGENNKEKALQLVKEEWGADDTVYYTVDNQSNNIYNISVRSKSTTATLAEYQVDVQKGTVTIM